MPQLCTPGAYYAEGSSHHTLEEDDTREDEDEDAPDPSEISASAAGYLPYRTLRHPRQNGLMKH